LELECVRVSGEPVEKARVWVSKAMLPTLNSKTERVTGGCDPSRAIMAQETDAHGRAEFRGIDVGEYNCRIVHDHLVVVGGDVLTRHVRCPTAPLRVVLEEPHALVLEIRGDTVLGASLAVDPKDTLKGLPHRELGEVILQLRERFPGSLVTVSVPRSPEAVVHWSGHVFLAQRGFQEVRGELRAWTSIKEPTVLDAGARAVAGDLGLLKLEVQDRDGGLVPADLFSAYRADMRRYWFKLNVPTSGTLPIPPGPYNLDAHDGVLRELVKAAKITVRPGAVVELPIRLDLSVAPVDVTVRTDDGDAFEWIGIQVATKQLPRSTRFDVVSGGPTRVWLPVGPLGLSAEVPGYKALDEQIVVERRSSGSAVQQVALRLSGS
jgi:hypothetical protein